MSIRGLLQRELLCITALAFHLPCFGQSSDNFQLLRASFSNGGGVANSGSFRIRESAIGGVAVGASASSNFALNGGTLITTVEDLDGLSPLPGSFLLLQNYPNPFNPETTITYALPEASDVKINIFNALGQLVRTFEQGLQEAGQYRLQWDGKNHAGAQVSSGVYYYQMVARGFREVRQMLLLR